MMKSITGLSILICCLLTVSCKRYQDGPYISLRSKEGRLTNHWDCTAALLISSQGYTPIIGSEINRSLSLEKDGLFSFYFERIEGSSYVIDSVSGDWILGQNKEALEFDCSIYFSSNSPYDSLFYLDINLLKSNKLRLLDAENKEFEFAPMN